MFRKKYYTRVRVAEYRNTKKSLKRTISTSVEDLFAEKHDTSVETIENPIPSTNNLLVDTIDRELFNENDKEIEKKEDENKLKGEEDLEYEKEEEEYDSFDEGHFESDNDDDDNVECEVQNYNDIDDIRKWAIECGIKHKHLTQLLCILKRKSYPDLPITAATFLKIEHLNYKIYKIVEDDDSISEYVYFSILNGLRIYFNPNIHDSDEILIQINIDGLPLFHSSKINFWPILCKVVFEPDIYKPFPVALYGGKGKCNDRELFLKDFVEEVNYLQKKGILIDNKLYKFKIQCFVCDTPARAFIKSTKGHTGFCSCERCYVHGERIGNNIVFDCSNAKKRTDQTFRAKDQVNHHTGTTPLLNIQPKIDMVQDFVLDFMHLCCSGIMKKLLEFWMQGNLTTKLSTKNRKILSLRMLGLRKLVPSEFQRKPRSTYELSYWKATEYRFFLLYCGPIVLKGLLSDHLFMHYLLLHAASRILCSSTLAVKYCRVAKLYLVRFAKLTKEYYGKSSLTMNMHNIQHLPDDVKHLKCSLNKITSFPHENLLGEIKRLLRSGNKPVAQYCKRLNEKNTFLNQKPELPKSVEILKTVKGSTNTFLKIKYKQIILSTKSPDNIVLLKNRKCFKIESISANKNLTPKNVFIKGYIWKIVKSAYKYPCDSSFLQTWTLENQPSIIVKEYPLSSIISKMVFMQISTGNTIKTVAVSYLQ